jgi:K+-transporting ATPase ATPase C chain
MIWKHGKETFGMMKLMFIMSMILGGIYPFVLTTVGHAFFPIQAEGSLIEIQHQVVGSRHLGQAFSSPQYFKGRPSLTDYQSDEIGQTELLLWGSKQLLDFTIQQRAQWPEMNYIPDELLYPSASMLDPNISWMGAVIQLASVAKARKIEIKTLYDFVENFVHSNTMINVLELNLALDKEFPES